MDWATMAIPTGANPVESWGDKPTGSLLVSVGWATEGTEVPTPMVVMVSVSGTERELMECEASVDLSFKIMVWGEESVRVITWSLHLQQRWGWVCMRFRLWMRWAFCFWHLLLTCVSRLHFRSCSCSNFWPLWGLCRALAQIWSFRHDLGILPS